jgi:hypothetical protein
MGPDVDEPTVIYTDASDYGYGIVYSDSENVDDVIAKVWSPPMRMKIIAERELFAALQHGICPKGWGYALREP